MTRLLRARILNICKVVTKVQRPCRIMWQTDWTEDCLLVKGEAMEASPSFTIGLSSMSSCIFFSLGRGELGIFLFFSLHVFLI